MGACVSGSRGKGLEPEKMYLEIYAETVRSVVNAFLEKEHIPGLVVGISQGEFVSFLEAFGISDMEEEKSMEPDMHMRVGGITMTFTSTVVLQLCQDPRYDLNLDDPISKHFPELKDVEGISVRMVGDMTSGLADYAGDEEFNQTLDKQPDKRWKPYDLLAWGLRLKHRSPGKVFKYSHTNSCLLGLLVERITRTKLAYQIQTRILEPLRLSQTFFASDATLPDPASRGYMYESRAYNLKTKNVSADTVAPIDVTYRSPSWAWAGGQMVSTVQDLLVYTRALARGTLLKPKMHLQRLRWTWQSENTYGFGLVNFKGWLGHTGQIDGFQSFVAHNPDLDCTLVILSNLYSLHSGDEPADALAKVLVPELLRQLT
eukprot:gb/GEZN01006890.1/.p1 GENE.gb/GEZN01006890.1/~~gb/GEZN01006890.1/.p1  ORF type:complete len:373 (-),score=19.55 gb/GEZN01006890.1/:377-1495(-)